MFLLINASEDSFSFFNIKGSYFSIISVGRARPPLDQMLCKKGSVIQIQLKQYTSDKVSNQWENV